MKSERGSELRSEGDGVKAEIHERKSCEGTKRRWEEMKLLGDGELKEEGLQRSAGHTQAALRFLRVEERASW